MRTPGWLGVTDESGAVKLVLWFFVEFAFLSVLFAIPTLLFGRCGFLLLGIVLDILIYAAHGHLVPRLDLAEHSNGAWVYWLSLGVGIGIAGAKKRTWDLFGLEYDRVEEK